VPIQAISNKIVEKMNMKLATLQRVALAAALIGSVALPSGAMAYDWAVADAIRAATPQCRDYPGAPVVGRVSGIMGVHPATGVSFVGCFGSIAACERWRGPVSGRISGRIILNECQFRR
jgi:hypothetical protein